MSDSRRFYRLPRQFDVEFAELKWGEEASLAGTTQNVSAAGVLLRAPTPVTLGTLIKMRFNVSGIHRFRPGFFKPDSAEAQQVVVLGRVVRVDEIEPGRLYDLGILFINIDPDDQEALMSYIEAKKQDPRTKEDTV